MKIAIDINYTLNGGGITQMQNMVRYFNQMNGIELIIYSNNKNLGLLRNVINRKNKIVNSWVTDLSVITRVLWQQLIFPFYLSNTKVDILFCPDNIAPYFSTVKTIQ